jgi:ADP-ribose pyrophosphatase YjhB (NUDIX family)
MTSDIYFKNAVDLVIFTVVDEENLPAFYREAGLVQPSTDARFSSPNQQQTGLSLYVVTVPAEDGASQGDGRSRMLPSGFMQAHETLRQAAMRIAEERLGFYLKTRLRQLDAFDEPTRDPSGRVISFPFWCMVNFEDISTYLGGRDRVGLELVNNRHYMNYFAMENGPIDFFDGVCRFGNRTMPSLKQGHGKKLTDDLPGGRILALDHDAMVFYAWRQLRHAFTGRLDPFRYLGINPLGAEFRISDLQEFTEVCRGEVIQRDLFRRQMTQKAEWVRATGRTDESLPGKPRPGKPANLYTLQVELEPEQSDSNS